MQSAMADTKLFLREGSEFTHDSTEWRKGTIEKFFEASNIWTKNQKYIYKYIYKQFILHIQHLIVLQRFQRVGTYNSGKFKMGSLPDLPVKSISSRTQGETSKVNKPCTEEWRLRLQLSRHHSQDKLPLRTILVTEDCTVSFYGSLDNAAHHSSFQQQSSLHWIHSKH